MLFFRKIRLACARLRGVRNVPARSENAELAVRAMQEISEYAAKNGTSELTLDEINEEISAVRNK